MGVPLFDEIRALFRGANYAHLATLMPDGSPHLAPVWVDVEGDHILVITSERSLKARNAARDPRVAISVISYANPYVEVQVRGRVVERRPDPELKAADRVSRKYTGHDFPWRDNPKNRVVLVIEAERARYTVLPLAHVSE